MENENNPMNEQTPPEGAAPGGTPPSDNAPTPPPAQESAPPPPPPASETPPPPPPPPPPSGDPMASVKNFDPKKMNLSREFGRALSIIKCNEAMFDEVGQDNNATPVAIIFYLLPLILSTIILLIHSVSVGSYMMFWFQFVAGISQVVSMMFFPWVAPLVSQNVFKGKGEFWSLFRVMGYASVVNLLSIVTTLGFVFGGLAGGGLAGLIQLVVGIWMLYVAFKIMKRNFGLETGNTIITIIIAAVATAIVSSIVTRILYSVFGVTSYSSPVLILR